MFLGSLVRSAKKHKKIPVNGISFDSRKVKKGNIFFAIKGDRFDGNDFIKHALDKGASFIVTSNKELITNKKCIYVIRIIYVFYAGYGRAGDYGLDSVALLAM